jgi:hypothetical protein
MLRALRPLAPVVVAISAPLLPAGAADADHIEGTSCGASVKCAGHEHWPRMTMDDVQRADKWHGSALRGKPNNTDELLGWHGSDRLFGHDQADVLWADHVGEGQPKGQWDRIWGGDGGDFIYSSRGRNTIYAGPGNDAIKTRYGRGRLDCGAGRDVVYVPKSRRRNWTFRNCEKYDGRSEAQRGGGIKPLP